MCTEAYSPAEAIRGSRYKEAITLFNIGGDANIKITRGDTGVIAINLKNKDGTEYVMQTGDVLVITVKRSTYVSDVLFQKAFGSSMQAKIEPADTANLSYGTYWYDVQLTTAGGDVFTVVVPHKLEVMPEVTWNG